MMKKQPFSELPLTASAEKRPQELLTSANNHHERVAKGVRGTSSGHICKPNTSSEESDVDGVDSLLESPKHRDGPFSYCTYYTYPVLEFGRSAFAKARADPLASNINGEMVLLWNDATVHHDDGVNTKSLETVSIEEVLEDLKTAAEQHLRDRLNEYKNEGVEDSRSVETSVGCVDRSQGMTDSGYVNDDHHAFSFEETDLDFVAPNQGKPESKSSELSRLQLYLEQPGDASRPRHEEPGLFSFQMEEDSIKGVGDDFSQGTNPTKNGMHGNLSRIDSGHFEGSSNFTSVCSSRVGSASNASSSFWPNESTEEFSEVFVDEFSFDKESPRGKSGRSCDDVVDIQSTIIRCSNPLCGKARTLDVARHYFKNCHNCPSAYYCSKSCRKEDWGRHKSTYCHGSRVNSACKRVIKACNSDEEIRDTLTRLARRGYLTSGRGCVLLGFPDLSSAEDFLEFGLGVLELNPIFVTLAELNVSKMFGDVYSRLTAMCQQYDPQNKFVLNVGIGARWNRTFCSTGNQDSPGLYGTLDSGYGGSLTRKPSRNKSRSRSGSIGSDGGYSSLNASVCHAVDTSSSLPPVTSGQSGGSGIDGGGGGFSYQDFSDCILRHKGPIIQKCIKLRLRSSPIHFRQPSNNSVYPNTDCSHQNNSSYKDNSINSTKNSYNVDQSPCSPSSCRHDNSYSSNGFPSEHLLASEESQRRTAGRYGPTLILTGIAGSRSDDRDHRKRQLSFINVQRQLRLRGVSLRHQFPLVYKELVDYVTEGRHFPSQIIYPVDTVAKKLFMCVLMPEVEANLDWTQSQHLLDDLDISKESIFKSLSRSRSLCSSLHTLHRHSDTDHNTDRDSRDNAFRKLSSSFGSDPDNLGPSPPSKDSGRIFHHHESSLGRIRKSVSTPNIASSSFRNNSASHVGPIPNNSNTQWSNFHPLPCAASSPKTSKSRQWVHPKVTCEGQHGEHHSFLIHDREKNSRHKQNINAPASVSNTGHVLSSKKSSCKNTGIVHGKYASNTDSTIHDTDMHSPNFREKVFPESHIVKQGDTIGLKNNSSLCKLHSRVVNDVTDKTRNSPSCTVSSSHSIDKQQHPAQKTPWLASQEHVNTIVRQWKSSPLRKESKCTCSSTSSNSSHKIHDRSTSSSPPHLRMQHHQRNCYCPKNGVRRGFSPESVVKRSPCPHREPLSSLRHRFTYQANGVSSDW